MGQPASPQQGREPPHAPSASPNRLDFGVDANRQSGAAGTSPVLLPQRHSLQSRHHRRKRKCPLELDPALLPEDSALPNHIPHSHPAGHRCSPEVQPLIPSSPMPCSTGSRPLWKCLVPPSSSELKKQEEGMSGREGNHAVPAGFSGTGTPRHSLHLHCPAQQCKQGESALGPLFWQADDEGGLLQARWEGAPGACRLSCRTTGDRGRLELSYPQVMTGTFGTC